jgi:tRNA (guanine-N7-)-methyltransferase
MKFEDIDFDKYPMPKRVRHHVSPNMYFPADRQKEMTDYYPPLYETIDWRMVFADGRGPDALDVGCGKGRFLLKYALENPGENVLGVEIRRPLVRWINSVIKGEHIGNAHTIWYSVVNGLDFIESGSVGRIFYLFPDPWPKKKHIKRRAFSADFLDDCKRILRPGGKLYLATDVPEVDEYHREALDCHGGFDYIRAGEDEWTLPVTDKENFCLEKKIPVRRLICFGQ